MMKYLTVNKEVLLSKQILLTFLKNKKNTILPVIIVFCLPVSLYLQTLSFGFTCFDDDAIISGNITFLSDFKNAPRAFLNDAFLLESSPLYRPIQTISYMVDILLSGGKTWIFHFTNILLLGLIACLLFLLLRKFLIPVKLALLSTLVYCAHPLFISSVAWIPARGDLLLVFFTLLSFLFYIEYLQKKNVIWLILNWLSFTIALFCKETAVFLPVLFAIYYFAFSSEKRFKKKYLLNIMLYGISCISWFLLHSIAIVTYSNGNNIGLISFISNLRTIPESLTNFFLPFEIPLIPDFSLFKTLTGLGIMILIIILFFINNERTKKEKVFYLSWYLFLLLPTFFFKHEHIDYLNHRFFLPMIGVLLFVLSIIPKKWFVKRERIIYLLMLTLFFSLASITFVKALSYSDPMTYYNFAITENPDNALLYNNRGNIKANKNDLQGAINDYTKAIELDPNYAQAYYNRVEAYKTKSHFAYVIINYNKAIELNPKDTNAYYNRAIAYETIGDLTMAIKDYDKTLELDSNFVNAYANRGNAYNKKDDIDMAIKNYDKAIEINPDNAEAYNNRGVAYTKKGNLTMAIKDYNKVIELNPNFVDAYNNRGIIYDQKGEHEMAIKDYNKSIELAPDYPNAYYNRGLAYKAEGKLKEAEQDFKFFEELMNKK